jgi:hypothetical protein
MMPDAEQDRTAVTLSASCYAWVLYIIWCMHGCACCIARLDVDGRVDFASFTQKPDGDSYDNILFTLLAVHAYIYEFYYYSKLYVLPCSVMYFNVLYILKL